MSKKAKIDGLLDIMARLRDPDGGCPWDLEQDFASIAPYTLEEAYEVAEAIREGDMDALKNELGDLLFQVVYHARMAEEAGAFNFDDVVTAISDKMVRRHPHVFGDGEIADADAQTDAWEAQKATERSEGGEKAGTLDDIPLALPALIRAIKLQKRASRVGFDWNDVTHVLKKLSEEMREMGQSLVIYTVNTNWATRKIVAGELGDILFTCANLARHLDIDPEDALRMCNAKFESRFRFIETELAKDDKSPSDASLEEMEALWQRAKRTERTPIRPEKGGSLEIVKD